MKARAALILFAVLTVCVQLRYTVMLGNHWLNGRVLAATPGNVSHRPLRLYPENESLKKAGAQNRDVVLAVDATTVGSRIEFFRAVLARPAGSEVTLRLRRGTGDPFDVRYVSTPMETGPRDAVLLAGEAVSGFVTPWLCLVLGLFVAWRRPHDVLAWTLLVLLWGISQSARVNGLHRLAWESPFSWLAIINEIMATGAGLVAWHWFGTLFPDPRSRFRILAWSRWVLGVPFLAVMATVAVAEAGMSHAPEAFAGLAEFAGKITGRAINWMQIAMIVLGWANLVYRFVREPQPAARRKLKLLLAGLVLGIGPLFMLAITQTYQQWQWSQTGMLVVVSLMLLVPVTMAYVVLVEKAMDVAVVVRQGLQYALAARSVAVLRGLLIMALIWLAMTLGADTTVSRPVRLRSIALCVAAVLLVRRVSEWLRGWVDRRFFREAVNAEQVLVDLSQQVHRIVDPQTLLRTVADRVSAALHVPHVAALVADGGGLRTAYALGGGATMPLPAGAAALLRSTVSAVPVPAAAGGAELLLPLRSKNELLGALSLGPKQSEEPYSAADLRLLESVASQTGLALENTRLAAAVMEEAAHRERINRELEIAREVQQRLFPKTAPVVPELELAGMCRPAQEIGGDYYDFVATPGGEIGLAIGDVSGKGVSAALLMSGLQASLRALTAAGLSDLSELMAKLNRLIYDATPASRFATFFYGLFDPATGGLRYSSAGHNPALLVRAAGGRAEWLRTRGVGLGLAPASRYEQAGTRLERGDVLVLYTDGVTEAMNPGQECFGEEALVRVVSGTSGAGAAQIQAAILAAVDEFAAGAQQHDDITLIVVRRTG